MAFRFPFFSHHIGNVIIPTDFLSMIFQRGGSTINGLVEGKIETGKPHDLNGKIDGFW
jgi:hypothetical protein